jgi:hypothetical protein
LPYDTLFAVTRTVRTIVLALFVVGSAMFWVAIFLPHTNRGKSELAQTLQEFGLLMAALSLAIGVFTRRSPPKS